MTLFIKCSLNLTMPKKDYNNYGFSSLERLWDASKICNKYVSVDVKDKSLLQKSINACSISLLDIKKPICCEHANLEYPNDAKFIDKCIGHTLVDYRNKNVGRRVHSFSNYQLLPSDTTIGEFTIWKQYNSYIVDKYKPFGLKNFTGKCCYMNSLIQVLLCICAYDKSNPGNIHISESKEGKLVQDLLILPIRIKNANQRHDNKRFYNKTFINKCAKIETILDGSQEQDVHECFSIFKNIFEKGTRTCLLDNTSDATDDMFTSLPQFWFAHGQKVSYVCKKCNNTSYVYENVLEHNIVPLQNATTLEMLSSSLTYDVNKGSCNGCGNKLFTCKVNFTDHPRILCLLVLRYTYENGTTAMNFAPVNISTEMIFDSTKYELLSVIHHHRSDITRHYTSTVKYLKYFHIDDYIVTDQQTKDLEKSQSAYLIMYRQTNKLQLHSS